MLHYYQPIVDDYASYYGAISDSNYQHETYLHGNEIYLKTLQINDITDDYINWINDKEVNHCLESRSVIHTRDTVQRHVKLFEESEDKLLFGIFLKDKKFHIGDISFSDINTEHGYGVIGIAIGRKEYMGNGYGKEAVRLLVDYGFNELGLRIIEATIYSNNLASQALFKKCGFKPEAVLKNHLKIGDCNYVDQIIVSLTNPKYC